MLNITLFRLMDDVFPWSEKTQGYKVITQTLCSYKSYSFDGIVLFLFLAYNYVQDEKLQNKYY